MTAVTIKKTLLLAVRLLEARLAARRAEPRRALGWRCEVHTIQVEPLTKGAAVGVARDHLAKLRALANTVRRQILRLCARRALARTSRKAAAAHVEPTATAAAAAAAARRHRAAARAAARAVEAGKGAAGHCKGAVGARAPRRVPRQWHARARARARARPGRAAARRRCARLIRGLVKVVVALGRRLLLGLRGRGVSEGAGPSARHARARDASPALPPHARRR
jgi:hypothetical protein